MFIRKKVWIKKSLEILIWRSSDSHLKNNSLEENQQCALAFSEDVPGVIEQRPANKEGYTAND